MINTCRICLRNDELITNDIENYRHIIKNIAQIELILNDEYPSKVCEDCSQDLLNANLLREMLLECNQIIKKEVEDPEFENVDCDDDDDHVFIECKEELEIDDKILATIDMNEHKVIIADDDFEVELFDELSKGGSNSQSPLNENFIEDSDDSSQVPPNKRRRKQNKVTLRTTEKRKKHSSPIRIATPDLRPPAEEVDPTSFKKEPSYSCHYCNTLQPNLEIHMKTIHPDEELIFKCRFCEQVYTRYNSLKDHVYKIHKNNKIYTCDECGQEYTIPCRLKEHKIKAHSEERNFICPFCTARFKLKANLNAHMKLHTGLKRYKCEFCEKAYSHYSDWKAHLSTHTGVWRYNCQVCNKGFYKPSQLKVHLRSHES